MPKVERRLLWVSALLVLGAQSGARGQLALTTPSTRYELSETVQLDVADHTVQALLDRARQCVEAQQWQEAVTSLRLIMETAGEKLVAVVPKRYVTVREYCQLQLVGLPQPALALYRSWADPLAKKWYETGVAQRDRRPLEDLVTQALASSWGDNALWALGEMALEAGDPAAARAYWEKIIPWTPPEGAPRTWLSVPETDLDLAAVRARLVLASILEGATDRAREEIARLANLHPDAKGPMGGRQVNYVEFLRELLIQSLEWSKPAESADWPTFAGAPGRMKRATGPANLGEVVWRIALRPTSAYRSAGLADEGASFRVAEGMDAPLSYHPVVAGDLVFAANQTAVLAVDLKTGQPVWGQQSAEIFREALEEQFVGRLDPAPMLGTPRFTLTVCDGKLYARLGTAVTTTPLEAPSDAGRGYLVCLDLRAQGRLVWKIAPEESGWAIDGTPVADGTSVYVAMRRSDVRPQAHVACFDAETGRLRWRRFVCAAETPGRGMIHQATHNLLTRDHQTLYFNTNLGAVAALNARDGRIQWVSLYPRTLTGDLSAPEPYSLRDLNPCVVDRGKVLVAPADSRRIFAMDAATGQILWQSGPEVEDVVHLLGTSADCLIASGHKLYWIELEGARAGRVRHRWPDGHERLGYGRGVLVGDWVYWPTRETLYVFQQADGQLKRSYALVPRGLRGGNLVPAGEYLLIAGQDSLVALGPPGRAPSPTASPLTQRAIQPGWSAPSHGWETRARSAAVAMRQ